MKRRLAWLALLLVFALIAGCGDDDDDDNNAADDDDDDDDDDNDTAADDLLATAQDLADTWLAAYPPETMGWSWDSGVLMLALWNLGEATGEARYQDYVAAWLDGHIAAGYTIAYNDHVPPARLALRLWQKTGDAKYRAAVDAAKTYIFDKAERLSDGALVHMGWTSPGEIWADTIFMVTPFLVEAGVADDDPACFAEAVLQFETFAAHLRDADTGLYRHMFDEDDNSLMPPVEDYWGRGNAWIQAASGTAFLDLPADQAGRDGVRDRYAAQLAALAAAIDDTGRWHTIVNRPDTYLETSVGPLVAYGVYQAAAADEASEADLVVADRALRGALDQVVVDEMEGTLLLGTSYGTGPSTWEMYQEVLKGEQVNYGIGATILAICAREALGRDAALPAGHATDETYIHYPGDDDLISAGYFYVARGNFDAAATQFAGVDNADSAMGLALIEAIRLGMAVLADIDALSLGDMSLTDFIDTLLADARTAGAGLYVHGAAAAASPQFSRLVERVVMTEQGGSTAFGPVEVDRGEGYLLGGIGAALLGVADVVEGLGLADALEVATAENPVAALNAKLPFLTKLDLAQVGDGVDELIAAIDALVAGIEEIDAETDDQSDDLIPRNLLHLEGDFYLPGVMLPTPVDELLAGLGIDVDDIGPMPETLLDLLAKIRGVLVLLGALMP